jgi:anti-sigma regulatory factor (Ser/Thr protein kinase)
MNLPLRDAIALPIKENSQVGEARRAATALAARLGFDESRRSDVGIVVTELGANLVRHAQSGQLLLRALSTHPTSGIEIMSLDKGPGIANVSDAMEDGFSTSNTPGNGLGAVRRLSDTFDVYSMPQSGTAILSRLWRDPAPSQSEVVGVVCLPKPGEDACGDAWRVVDDGVNRTVFLVADGLGHGVQAADASRQAVKVFAENVRHSTAQIVELLHAALRSTRGAALAVAEVRRAERQVHFTGIGNISASLITGTATRSMVSQNGTAGAEARRIQEFVYPWSEETLLVMHSDGLATQWQVGKYNGLRFRDPSVIAGVLYRDYRRERDDVTVLVARDQKRA